MDAAVERRRALKLPPFTNVVRYVHEQADHLPRLVVEGYGSWARLEMKDEGYLPWADALGHRLLHHGFGGVVFVHRTGKKAVVRPLVGRCPTTLVVQERGHRYAVRLVDEDAVGTGIFVDLREGRAMAEEAARGRPFLNLFAHAGAYGVAGLCGGASRVDHVDSGKKTASWAALNLALNGADPRQHKFIIDDAFKVLQKRAKRGPTYGVIACDPPTTALRPSGKRFVVRDELDNLARDACAALLDGGLLVLTCNDRNLTTADVERAARAGAALAGRDVDTCLALPLPPDLPPGGDVPVRGVGLRLR